MKKPIIKILEILNIFCVNKISCGISRINEDLFFPCHTGCLVAIWIRFRRWGKIDVSWPSLNNRDVGSFQHLAICKLCCCEHWCA